MTTSPHAVPTMLAAPRVSLRYAQYAVDVACLVGAYWLAHALRFDFDIPASERAFALERAPFVLAYQLILVWALGVHRFVWRYVGIREVGAFVRGALLAIAPLVVLRFLTLPDDLRAWRMPISVAFLDGTLAFAGLLGFGCSDESCSSARRAPLARGQSEQEQAGVARRCRESWPVGGARDPRELPQRAHGGGLRRRRSRQAPRDDRSAVSSSAE
ncbi:MAG: hypothetical protein R3B99_28580 [Polyangiales bacterium]